jgi:hydroxymethylpyrimidine/phosphomethylpyrimidine kinase
MVATSGAALMKSEAVSALTEYLLPISTLATPNIPEAEVLSGMKIETKNDMQNAAKQISDVYGCNVLLKGGHSISDADDLLYSNGQCHWLEGKRINNPNTHGTGCTLSSAIAANLAKGLSLTDSVIRAKEFVTEALSAMLDLGQGNGPMNHAFDINSRFAL